MINPIEEITPEWLLSWGFEESEPYGSVKDYSWYIEEAGGSELDFDPKNYIWYSFAGLYLSYWTDHWRFQVGGTENMWECLHVPTQGMVANLMRALGRDILLEDKE